MANCKKCGKEIFGVVSYCPDCEKELDVTDVGAKIRWGWVIFGFVFFPLISLIVGIKSKKTDPSKFKSIWIGEICCGVALVITKLL